MASTPASPTPSPRRLQVGQQREQQNNNSGNAPSLVGMTSLSNSGSNIGQSRSILSTLPSDLEPLVAPSPASSSTNASVISTSLSEVNNKNKRQAMRTQPLKTSVTTNNNNTNTNGISSSGSNSPGAARPAPPNKDLPPLPPSPTNLRSPSPVRPHPGNNPLGNSVTREPTPPLPPKPNLVTSGHRETPIVVQPVPLQAILSHREAPPIPIASLHRDPNSAREGVMTSSHREQSNSNNSINSSNSGIITSAHREHPFLSSSSSFDSTPTSAPAKVPFRGLMPGASGGISNDIASVPPKLPPKPMIGQASSSSYTAVASPGIPPPPPPRLHPPKPPPPPPIVRRNTRSAHRESIFTKELPPLEVGEYIHHELDNVSQIIFRPGTCAITENKCKMFITNYQLILYSKTKNTFIPLYAIDKIKSMIGGETNKKKTAIHLRIQNSGLGNFGFTVTCKYPYETHLVSKERTHITAFQTTLEKYVYITRIDRTFAFTYREQISKDAADLGKDNYGWDIYTIYEDLTRLGLHTGYWKISEVNSRYDLCDTYPSVLVFPSSMTHKELIAVANFRSKRRLPSTVWRHSQNNAVIARCSQPRKGLMGNRCKEDEKLFEAIRDSGTGRELHLLDCRPIVNAYANRLKGAGVESAQHYQNCRRVFLNIENIHAMRNSLLKLSKSIIHLRMGEISERELDCSTWLQHIELVLSGAYRAAQLIDAGESVVIHCSDGWDRTSQLSALAQLMLDSHYRTLRGFELLVEKEWLAFGHMFQKRTGFGNRDERKKQRSQTAPIFVQFVDCVYQFQKQCPNAFQFNENFLVTILKHLHQGQYGTFFLNSEQQRAACQLKTKTVSLWAYINANSAQYTNPNYAPVTGFLIPRIDPVHLKLWTNYYLGFT
eukprot:TRINITY_DN4137_c0_g1_i1.p1 TRINITY_DN4137_c0_g1~~TRINITY_DN4137_c0_g1_i1.p1  ORF type:complete len:888 (-),score=179.76 TRINITY_DN4137_c0_g1_i1:28-2691(-)